MLTHLIDAVKGKHPIDVKRSPRWPAVRASHLMFQPRCAVCNGTTQLEVHHIKPFHLFPELELSPNNLITLCEASKGGVICHLFFGHLGNYKSYNLDVVAHAADWQARIRERPLLTNDIE